MKESLTEHLCTIIHENEVRKAKKLEELVNKLEVDNLDDFETQLIEESKAPQSPTTKLSEKASNDAESDSNKSAQIETSVVTETNQAASENPSPETLGTSTGDPQISCKTTESQTPESAENQTEEGTINVQSNNGAKQDTPSVTSTSQVSEVAEENQDSSVDQKVEASNGTGSDITEPSSIS